MTEIGPIFKIGPICISSMTEIGPILKIGPICMTSEIRPTFKIGPICMTSEIRPTFKIGHITIRSITEIRATLYVERISISSEPGSRIATRAIRGGIRR